MMLRIIPGVGQELAERVETESGGDRRTKLDVVGLRSLIGQPAKIEVRAGVADSGLLGKVGFLES